MLPLVSTRQQIVVHVVLAQQRQVGLGLGQLAGVVELDRRLLAGDHRGALLGAVSCGPSGSRTAPTFISAWTRTTCSRRGCMRQGDGRAAADAVGGEPAGDPGRLGLELGVGDLRAVRDQRGAVGAALRSLGKPVVEFHRAGISLPIMPQRHKDAPPEEELYAPIEWRRGRRVRATSATRRRDGIAKITIDRPEVRNAFRPQTLIEISAALELAREDPEVGAIVLTGEGDRAFCSGGDQRVRGDTGYIAEGEPRSGRFHVTDLQVQMRRLPKPVVAMVAGYAVGGGHILHVCCDLTIAADNARFGQTGPRVGSWDGGFGASLLRDLVGTKKAKEFWLLCRSTTPRRRWRWAWSTPSSRSTSLERETVAWCREMLALSPFALRLRQVELQRPRGRVRRDPAARPRRQPPLLRRRGGPRGARGLQGEAQARLLEVPEAAMRIWLMAARPRTLPAAIAPVLVGTAAAVELYGQPAPGRRLFRRPRRQRSSSRSGPTSPTTTRTPSAGPTPPTASARSASPRPAWSRRSGS